MGPVAVWMCSSLFTSQKEIHVLLEDPRRLSHKLPCPVMQLVMRCEEARCGRLAPDRLGDCSFRVLSWSCPTCGASGDWSMILRAC